LFSWFENWDVDVTYGITRKLGEQWNSGRDEESSLKVSMVSMNDGVD
jgi:hypothetical protein